MIVLLEGADGSGKSTLARSLAGSHHLEVRHAVQPTAGRHPLEEYLTPLNQGDDVVLDRLHLSEAVYGPIFRGGSRLTQEQLRYVDLYLEARGCVLVHLTADPDVLWGRLEARGDETFVSKGHMQELVTAYHLAVAGSQIGAKLMNPPAQLVVSKARSRAVTARDLRMWPDYVGRRFPDVLLVGDAPNERRAADVTHVALAPYPGSCGEYLWDALDDPAFRSVGVVNSLWGRLATLWSVLGRPRVVALGANAEARLIAENVPCGRAPHPQNARRFHFDHVDDYRRILLDAAGSGARITSMPYRPRSQREAPST